MNLFQRFQDTFGFGDPYDPFNDEEGDPPSGYSDEYTEGSVLAHPLPRSTATPHASTPNNVIGVPLWAGAQMEVIVLTPRSFEEIPQAVIALRQRKSVVLNLSLVEPDQAQRCADYVAGGTFAIDGHQERLSESIFLFTPSSVHIHNYPLPSPDLPPPPSPSELVRPTASSPFLADAFPELNPL